MTIEDYIKGKFQSFGIQLSKADLWDVSLNGDDELTTENKREVEIAIAGFIPQLLLRPQSISENGFSASFSTQSIEDYYAFLCKQYGLENNLNTSSISDASNLW